MEKELTIQPRDVRIEVDLNSRGRDGYTFSRLSRASGPVAVGDTVTVFEPDDYVAAPARVVRVDRERDFVFLDVDWSSLDYDVARRDLPVAITVEQDGLPQSNAADPWAARLSAAGRLWVKEWVEAPVCVGYSPRQVVLT
jgi:hypothetical protein